ncbi:4-hydroxy-tetrahydrodipicolinate reductase [Ichthyobacterium seriolicida]|uniref:4-hydroxy-tetrahydrodipicolinate reductase n=1 Tax=Ichthyobacterium seriolicida TaxID=242600 RepID=A0A1J1E2N2_9FLAO|nr:4-hydroxy-tetrahydrodipicolinate reductase [Ichthyobacterium seriolicida]BAV94292.1 dihydrodipicolinate reductase [Ichthyobacterium seriolicida]
MNIALLGYGKMGKAIEKTAVEKGYKIVARIEKKQSNINFNNADIAIEFSTPSGAFENIKQCIENKIPVISGTTGWLDNYPQIVELCTKHEGTFLYSSNFSIGVNIFFEIIKKTSKIMSKFKNYSVGIEEIHHTEKKDSPSGTAIKIAEEIINQTDKTRWILNHSQRPEDIPIVAKRVDNTTGTHTVLYKSDIDDIEIKHTAHSREGFVMGVMLASEWILGKKGVFSFRDILEL